MSSSEYDLCIIGSGAAGLSLANELKDSGLKLIVVESGDRSYSDFADQLKKCFSTDLPIRSESRVRQQGGATNTWGGLASRLDEIDFKKRDWVPGSGWPISRADLNSDYEAAIRNYAFPDAESFYSELIESVSKTDSHKLQWAHLEEKLFLAALKPLRFGEAFSSIFERRDLELLLNASVSKLTFDSTGQKVLEAEALFPDRTKRLIRAKYFVICCGGIENARLMLLQEPLAKRLPMLGKCFMNHPRGPAGHIRVSKSQTELKKYWGFIFREFSGFHGLRFSNSQQQERKTLNSYVRFDPIYPWSDNPGVQEFVQFNKRRRWIFEKWRSHYKGEAISLRDQSETEAMSSKRFWSVFDYLNCFWQMTRHLPSVSSYGYHRLANKTPNKISGIRIQNYLEMLPSELNRVVLNHEEKDFYGNPLPRVEASLSEIDRHSLLELHRALKKEVERNQLGEFVPALSEDGKNWPISYDASHHLGTTRMGDNENNSVVDANQKVHLFDNLYVAGGSVFPTSGTANPTLTIVAMTLRLSRHIKRLISAKSKSAA